MEGPSNVHHATLWLTQAGAGRAVAATIHGTSQSSAERTLLSIDNAAHRQSASVEGLTYPISI